MLRPNIVPFLSETCYHRSKQRKLHAMFIRARLKRKEVDVRAIRLSKSIFALKVVIKSSENDVGIHPEALANGFDMVGT